MPPKTKPFSINNLLKDPFYGHNNIAEIQAAIEGENPEMKAKPKAIIEELEENEKSDSEPESDDLDTKFLKLIMKDTMVKKVMASAIKTHFMNLVKAKYTRKELNSKEQDDIIDEALGRYQSCKDDGTLDNIKNDITNKKATKLAARKKYEADVKKIEEEGEVMRRNLIEARNQERAAMKKESDEALEKDLKRQDNMFKMADQITETLKAQIEKYSDPSQEDIKTSFVKILARVVNVVTKCADGDNINDMVNAAIIEIFACSKDLKILQDELKYNQLKKDYDQLKKDYDELKEQIEEYNSPYNCSSLDAGI